jgi:hypothetical protein
MIRSATETVFEEFFDLEDTVELGGVYFNIRTYEIIGFIPEEKLKNEIAVDLIALSVDPMAHKYWWITPYAYCNNNPIKLVDPNGMEFGDFYDFNGTYLGTDGVKDNKVYLVDENSVRDKVTPGNASDAMGKVKVETTYQELNEANEVYNRTTGNGGNREECSVVLDGVSVVTGQQGGDVSQGGGATTTLPPDKGANRTTSIHSHPLGDYKNDKYYAPEAASPADQGAFSNYSLNIIVGKSDYKMNAATGNKERVPQTVFYNSSSSSTIPLGTMSMGALRNVINTGRSRGRF